MPEPTQPRVPVPVPIDLLGEPRTLQVNHCRLPECSNFGVPAYHEIKSRRAKDQDPAYKRATSGTGIPALRCKACGDKPPIKSNRSVALELERLVESSGLLKADERASCPDESCRNHGRAVAASRKGAYHKRGRVAGGRRQRYQCMECHRIFSVASPVRLHDKNKRMAADVLGRIVNKSPMRGTVRGAGLLNTDAYYSILRFIEQRCRAHSGAVDRALADGRLSLPEEIVTQTDAQTFTLNWTSRLDRRNVFLASCGTVDARSGFILGLNAGFDGRVDPFLINREAALNGDLMLAEPFRAFAHYWLAGDELMAGRAMGRKIRKHDRVSLMNQITALYANAESRRDVEDVELDRYHPDIQQIPPIWAGLQTHEPYTVYAHWLLMRRILSGAGVQRLEACMDPSSMFRAGFLCAYVDEIKRGDANGFYVRYTKHQPIDERERILREAGRARKAFRDGLPPDVREDDEAVSRLMMEERIAAGREMGQWNDFWVEHPMPTMNEPHKAMCWLTPNGQADEDRMVDMFLKAGLARIDNVFMRCRRLLAALERPVGMSNDNSTVWNGYAPYNPRRVETYLTIFRAVSNWTFVGEDGRTPAMRLGFADEPFTYEDLLWPGERVPRPKRVRRKGRSVAIPG